MGSELACPGGLYDRARMRLPRPSRRGRFAAIRRSGMAPMSGFDRGVLLRVLATARAGRGPRQSPVRRQAAAERSGAALIKARLIRHSTGGPREDRTGDWRAMP